VIMLADADVSWPLLHGSIQGQPPGWPCSVGVGGPTREIADFPRSHYEAQLALRIQKAIGQAEQVTAFDELGVYKLLATEADASAMEAFVREWLGLLMRYDAVHGTQLITTLSEFLACGGSYADTARVLTVHRSTLKYRLRRIREVSGHDLGAPDVQFNLQVATRAWRTLQALRKS
jgi:DNA-binding PucR family transcriptional regulator